MTIYQIMALLNAFIWSLFYAEALWRVNMRLSFTNVIVWSVSIVAAIVSFTGVK